MSAETPRTDEAAVGFATLLVDKETFTVTELVDANFARVLERELAAAQQENERLRAQIAAPTQEPVAWMMPLGERGLIEWGHKRPDTGDLDKWRPLYSHSHECSDDFTGEIATPSKESLLEDLRLLSNLERAHKMESNSLFIENGQLRKSLKDVLRMLEAAHRQSGIHGTDNKRIVAARSVLNAPPSLYAAPQPDEAREKLRHIAREEECTCTDSSEDCRYCIAARALNECADIERDALAYLARTGGKEETK